MAQTLSSLAASAAAVPGTASNILNLSAGPAQQSVAGLIGGGVPTQTQQGAIEFLQRQMFPAVASLDDRRRRFQEVSQGFDQGFFQGLNAYDANFLAPGRTLQRRSSFRNQPEIDPMFLGLNFLGTSGGQF